MTLYAALPLPIVATAGNGVTLTSILEQSFGSASAYAFEAWLFYYDAYDLANSFGYVASYWNLKSPQVGTWDYYGSAVDPDSSTYVDGGSFDSAEFIAGNDIGPFAGVYIGSTWYDMITVDPHLINLPAGNQEPTPTDIVNEAYRFYSFYGWVPNTADCHNIASAVAAGVGATLGENMGSLDPTQNKDAGFWRVVYRGSDPNPVANWQTLVHPGDIVRLQWASDGGPHTTTVLNVNADGTMVVYDNSDYVNGAYGIGIHTVVYDKYTVPTSITIFRLTTDGLYLQTGDDAGDTIFDSVFNDKIVCGSGDDTVVDGSGNDIIDGGGGYNTVCYSGNFSQYQIIQSGSSLQVTDLRSGSPDGSDQLTNIQQLDFADRNETAPTVTASNRTATRGQSFAASSLFSVSDAENDTITKYALWDSAGGTGYWLVNGVVESTGVEIDVTAAQFAQTTFQSASGADHLWVRALDGTLWGNWTGFYVTAPIDHAPVVTTANFTATRYQNIAAASLFSVSDADHDTITAYQVWDSTFDATSGYWIVGGVAQSAGQAINVTPSQLSSATFQSGSGSDHLWVRAFDGVLWSNWIDFYVNAPADHAPVVSAADRTASHGQSFAASSLFSVSDADNDSIAAYQFWDSTPDPSSGHWTLGGVAQPAAQAINVTPAQLAGATFQSGLGSDDLWVRANDGFEWGAWTEFHVNAPIDLGPTVSVGNLSASNGQSFPGASLFSYSDPFNSPATQYDFWDSGDGGGHFVLNGSALGAGHHIVTAAQLPQLSYQSGSGADTLYIRANDGTVWGSWSNGFAVTAPIDNGPTVSVANLPASHGQSLTGAALFSNYSDPFSSPATQYDFWDTGVGGGHFVLNGTTLGAGRDNVIAAAQLAQLSYQSGSGADTLWVRANDGTVWGPWSNGFTVTAPIDNAPVVHVANISLAHGNANPLASSLFSVSDAEGDSITSYAFWDNGAGGGQFVLNGVAQPNGQEIDVTASQLPQLTYQASSGTDTLWVKANDGLLWSGWSAAFTVTAPPDQAPVVTGSNLVVALGAQQSAGSLFSVTDADNDTITQYDLWDTGAGGGHFALNGNTLGANQHNIMTAAQLAQTTYVAGSGTDTLWVRANDGQVWSAFSSGFTVTG